jgi:hypothetical protein
MPEMTEPTERAGIGSPMQNAMVALPPRPVTAPTSEDREFDAWLRGHLATLHAAVLEEPVPDRFLRLLRAGRPEQPAGT